MLRLAQRLNRTTTLGRVPLRGRCVPLSARGFSLTKVLHSDPIIGIDLGTTNSCVAFIEGGQPIVIENDGKRTTPSIFAIDKAGNRLIGQPAQRQMVVNPKNTFHGVKRLIGRRFDDDETKEISKSVSFKVVKSARGDAWVQDDFGKSYAPSEIASYILTRLKEAAEAQLGLKIGKAVITVPAYFDNAQRKATEDAGKIAGLSVERIINEPTAAALAYGVNRDEDKAIVVYDLGGGTFDVSILQIGGGVFEVKSTAGDTFLGGEDFNNVIVNHLVAEFKKKHGFDLAADKVALQRVREASESAKHDLSTRESVEINLPYIATIGGKPVTMETSLTRTKFEQLADPLIKKSIAPCKKALSDAGMTVDDIADVIMVGGMTRMPKVRDAVKSFFGKEPSLAVNPDEAVAIGAALQGTIITNSGLILGEDESRELILVDVTPLNLGIKVQSGEMVVIVPAQTTVPCRLSHTFTTVKEFQTEIVTEVYQGNRPMAADNRLIGQYTVVGIPAAPAGVPKIEVTFDISANGLITVTSTDLASKQAQSVHINMDGGLSDAEIEKMRQDAEANAAQDAANREKAKIKSEHMQTVNKLQRSIDDLKNLDAASRVAVQEKLEVAKKLLEDPASPIEAIESTMKDLSEKAGKVLEAAYRANVSQNADNTPPPKQ